MALALPTEDKCVKYAQFASHLERWQFKIIYWTMFITNLVLLFTASCSYTKWHYTQPLLVNQPQKRARHLRFAIYVCMACVALSAVVTVMEAYALLALQFCDGEDLIALYWSTWTMMQVGSLIAMVGLILALLHTLQNRRPPPWALALGTPVLVIAGFYYLFHDLAANHFKQIRRSSRFSQSNGNEPALSESGSISPSSAQDSMDNAVLGEFIGFTVAGGPIVRFQTASAIEFGPHMNLLGYSDGERPLVSYRKNSIQFISDNKEASTQAESLA